MKTASKTFGKFIIVMAASLSLAGLTGCVGAAVGAGAAVGVAAAQEGGIKGAVTDAAIRAQIVDLWFKHDKKLFVDVDMTVREGRVLLTGSVPRPDSRVDAVRLAWQADGVKQVINEITVDGGNGFTGFVTDTWITGNLKTRMLLDKYIQSINYTIDTVGGTVYLMGIAQDRKELDRVTDYARNTKYVKNVVSYVRLRGEVPAGVQEPTSRVTTYSTGQQNTAPPVSSAPVPEAVVSEPLPVTAEPLN